MSSAVVRLMGAVFLLIAVLAVGSGRETLRTCTTCTMAAATCPMQLRQATNGGHPRCEAARSCATRTGWGQPVQGQIQVW